MKRPKKAAGSNKVDKKDAENLDPKARINVLKKECLLQGICIHNNSRNLHLIVGLNYVSIFS